MFEKLKELACKHFKITKQQFEQGGRKAGVVYARIAIAQVLHETGYSVCEILEMIGKSKKTVLLYLRTFEDRIRFDHDFRNIYKRFKEECD